MATELNVPLAFGPSVWHPSALDLASSALDCVGQSAGQVKTPTLLLEYMSESRRLVLKHALQMAVQRFKPWVQNLPQRCVCTL